MIKIEHIEPRKELCEYIRRITLFKSTGHLKYLQKLTPSAYSYLSYNCADIPISKFGNKSIKPTEKLIIAGPKTDDNMYVEYNGKLHQLLLEFTGVGFYQLFKISPSAICNSIIPFKNIIGSSEFLDLEEALGIKDSVNWQVNILEELLIDRIHNVLPIPEYVASSLKIIEMCHGHNTISDLLSQLNIGKRQFNRKFQEIIGVPPKTFCKIVQLHYVINIMRLKKYTSLQEISNSAEYYDHPHFANRFKELTGFTPNEFIKSDKHIALKYFYDLK